MGLLRLGNVLFRHPVPEAQHVRQGWAESPALVPPEGIISNPLQMCSAMCLQLFATCVSASVA